MGRRQVPKVVNGITIPAIGDDSFENSDHIPVYSDLPWHYSWIEGGACNKQVVTGGAVKVTIYCAVDLPEKWKKSATFRHFQRNISISKQ